MHSRSRHVAHHFWVLFGLWAVVIILLLLGEHLHQFQSIKEIALTEATAYLNKDLATRLWAAELGGIYVPITEASPPNPFLSHVPERDIQTPGGQTLTLMNPAYMIRQIMARYSAQYGVRGHLTSLKYFREETAPDSWERSALAMFEDGIEEVMEVVDIEGRPYLRLMKPLVTEAQCLKCHAAQGYRVGDIRGGVSVSLPMSPYLEHHRREMAMHAVSLGILWLLGSMGLGVSSWKLTQLINKNDKAEALLRIAHNDHQTLVDSSLTGIYTTQEGLITFCNARFAEMHGYRPNEMIGMASLDLIHPIDWSFVAELNKKRIQGEPVPDEYEARCITREGKTIWVQRRNAMIQHEGKPAVLGNEIDITTQKQAEKALRASENQLKRVVTRLLHNQEVERKSIALEIHDEVAQVLSAIKLRIESLLEANHMSPQTRSDALMTTAEQIKEEIQLIRQVTKRLRPIMLDDLGIRTAILTLCRETAHAGKGRLIEPNIDVNENLIPDELKIVIYRVLEELLSLSSRWCGADRCDISLKAGDDKITLVVQIWGRPIDRLTDENDWELSMAVIRNRAESFGGAIEIESNDDKPANTITVWWPLDREGKNLLAP